MTFFRFYSFFPHPPECEENYSYILGHIGLIVPSSHLSTEDMPLIFWKGVPGAMWWARTVCTLELIFTFDSETFLLVFLLQKLESDIFQDLLVLSLEVPGRNLHLK